MKQLREAMGLTQEQFAAKVGVTLATVNRWENGRAEPQPLAVKMMKALREQHGLKQTKGKPVHENISFRRSDRKR